MELTSHLLNFSAYPGFRAKPAGALDIRKAYTLAQTARPELGLDDWHAMVDRRRQPDPADGAWVVLEDFRSYIHAMFFCQLGRRADEASVLQVSDMVAAELPGPAIADSTAACVDHLARHNGARWLALVDDGLCTARLLNTVQARLQAQGWLVDAPKLYRYDPRLH